MPSTTPVAAGDRRHQLRDYLRTRRARLTPEDVGMAPGGRRRTPGLRREEVAVLAGVGVSWYTWLEQGRDINVSAEVLDSISRALRLNGPERSHLYILSGLNPPRGHEPGTATVTPELRNLIDGWMPRPAMLRDRYWNLLAVNDAARTVFGYGDTDHNCLISFFTNAMYRAMYVHWAAVAPEVVAAFRADAAEYLGDPGFDRVVEDLGAVSPEFTELWARHDVGEHVRVLKAIRHPEAGGMVFDKSTVTVADHPDWRLDLYSPKPGTGTEERMAWLMGASARP
ncbi:helix-turn-helix transcriptional regulator [Nocardiopsis suaedae]|uniref:Helix-turn-helix transcriptional regulator n=1 Tax=Nocardiopsis suaedae TaxID=3018444 RepID=A0ABT4TFA8_9ACTN|nr:helix-turn-helix transcriptional regulator [Nocardiopsis suaedae]MDA2803340.1 helix-turn-helix transcriptional regulator [Nocardiopsis suaedae]